MKNKPEIIDIEINPFISLSEDTCDSVEALDISLNRLTRGIHRVDAFDKDLKKKLKKIRKKIRKNRDDIFSILLELERKNDVKI
jgi:hypothetical protein